MTCFSGHMHFNSGIHLLKNRNQSYYIRAKESGKEKLTHSLREVAVVNNNSKPNKI